MFRMCALRERPHISQLRVLALACLTLAWVLPCLAQRRLYLISGEPTLYGGGLSVYLYSVGAKGVIRLERPIFEGDHGYLSDVRDDRHGTIYVNGGNTQLAIIHENQPDLSDYISVPQEGWDMCWGAVAGQGQPSAAVFCQTHPAPLTRILADPQAPKRIAPGSFSLYRGFQYTGRFLSLTTEQIPGGVNFVGHSVTIWMENPRWPTGDLIAPGSKLPAELESSSGGALIADSDNFLAIATYFTKNGYSYVSPVPTFVFDKRTRAWTKYSLPTTATENYNTPSVRILGNWLVTTENRWQGADHMTAGGNLSLPAGQLDQRTIPLSPDPGPVPYFMGDAPYRGLYFPGIVLLQNLADGRRITLKTGLLYTEVLAIRPDGLVLYRVNDALYEAEINGDTLEPAKLVAKDQRLWRAHWAFWSPVQGGTRKEPSGRGPRSER